MRTREEQIAALRTQIFNADCFTSLSKAEEKAESYIIEAERRAEQRVRVEIRQDSERLDWLEKLPRTEAVFEDRLRVIFFTPIVGPWDSLRETIDAAREVG